MLGVWLLAKETVRPHPTAAAPSTPSPLHWHTGGGGSHGSVVSVLCCITAKCCSRTLRPHNPLCSKMRSAGHFEDTLLRRNLAIFSSRFSTQNAQ